MLDFITTYATLWSKLTGKAESFYCVADVPCIVCRVQQAAAETHSTRFFLTSRL